MAKPRNIVVLTGAGISAESGVATFRDPDGVWARFRIEDVATPDAFARHPERVHAFYNKRRADLALVEPNAAHRALARLEAEYDGELLLVTQNVDHLHEAAGSSRVIHMHGELTASLCSNCGDRRRCTGDLSVETTCIHCGRAGSLRPDVVWFGEIPYHMDLIENALATCDLFVSIGTSGNVYPAAGFVAIARAYAARTLELNLEPSAGTSLFDGAVHGRATIVAPDFVDGILAP